MCGRTCMTLAPEELKCACKFKKAEESGDEAGEESVPQFRNEYNLGLIMKPSHNVSPGEVCSIIVSSKHFDEDADDLDRTVMPALWGIVPRWHKGDFKKHGLTTNNARIESVETSKLYKPLLDHGKRCIIPVEGFYEWQTINPKLKPSERAVYYVHMPQEPDVKIEDKSTWKNVNLMFVAGLFDVWHDDNGDSLYSFTVITYESDKHFDWLHHRTPAILETKQQITNWLNFNRTPSDLALKLIKHPKTIVWHQVSNLVNSSRNKSDQCNKPKSETAKNNSLMSWIKKRKSEPDSPGNSSKRSK